MNRRIAKKLSTVSHRLADGRRIRCTVWNSWWAEVGNAGLHNRAQQIYDRSTAYGQTQRLLRHLRGKPDVIATQAIIDRWPELRRRIRAHCGNREGVEGQDSYQFGFDDGKAEMERVRSVVDRDETVSEFLIGELSYFSDRWCMQRLGRMDGIIAAF